MGAYLNKPVVEKEKVHGDGKNFTFACTSMQGWRANQEDAHNCIVDLHDGWHMFAVYDGHGGSEVSKYTSEKFPDFLKERKFWDEAEIEQCLQKAFVDFDEFIRSDESMNELRKLNDSKGGKKSDSDDEEDEADRIGTIEESGIPIKELMEKYGINLGGGGAKSLLSAFLNKQGIDEESSDEDEDEEEEEEEDAEKEDETEEQDKKEEITDGNDENIEKSDKSEKSKQKKRCNKSPIHSEAKKSKSEETKEDESHDAKGDEEVKTTKDAPASSDGPKPDSTEEDDEDDEDFVANEDEEEEEQSDEEVNEDDFENIVLGGGGETPGEDSGTTACVCLVGNGKIIVANAGDSRAVLCRAGKAIDLSVDHKPEDAIETARIHNAGGVIEEGRVNGGLNLSRALGDHAYKKNAKLHLKEQMITAHPDVKIEDFTKDDEFLIVACDGIWNSMESQEVVDFAREMLAEGKTCGEVCDALCDKCLADSTDGDGTGCDNMTVICTQFTH